MPRPPADPRPHYDMGHSAINPRPDGFRMVTTKKKIIIGLVAIVVVGFIAFAAFGTAVTEKNARYNYDLREIDSYQDGYIDYTHTPAEGKKFIALDCIIANDKVPKGFYNNELNVIWTVEMPNHTSLTWTSSEATYPTPDLIKIEQGGKAKMAFCWEVSEDLDIASLKVSCEYDGGKLVNFEYDPDLKL